jgi:hypothetical protein
MEGFWFKTIDLLIYIIIINVVTNNKCLVHIGIKGLSSKLQIQQH